MAFDRAALIAACGLHGRVARVVVAGVKGSAPREVGAAMLVWSDGQSGTVGGGALEHQLTESARRLLAQGDDQKTHHALGPNLGQCCGGAVDILTEVYDLSRAEAVPTSLYARGPGAEPLGVTRLRAAYRNGGALPQSGLVSGWMVEPIHAARQRLWVWGAGHVGRALVDVLAPLPDFDITWVDTDPNRFPELIPNSVTQLYAATPAALVPHAPPDARHLILTYSHALDLELCHQLLGRGFASVGLIGSATKWARFQKRLGALGRTPEQINRITCPIGEPALGKHPSAIAIGVAARLLRPVAAASMEIRA